MKKFILIVDTQGLETAVKWNKEVRLLYTKSLVKDPEIPKESRVSKSSRVPKELTHFREFLDDPYYQRIILSVLYMTRAFIGGTPVSLKTITDTFLGEEDINDRLKKAIPSFKRSLQDRKNYHPRFRE